MKADTPIFEARHVSLRFGGVRALSVAQPLCRQQNLGLGGAGAEPHGLDLAPGHQLGQSGARKALYRALRDAQPVAKDDGVATDPIALFQLVSHEQHGDIRIEPRAPAAAP